MTHTRTEQPEALPQGRELAILLSQGHYSMREAVDEIRRQWQEIDNLQYRIKKLEASQERVPLSAKQRQAIFDDLYPHGAPPETLAVFAAIVDAIDRHGITQEKQG